MGDPERNVHPIRELSGTKDGIFSGYVAGPVFSNYFLFPLFVYVRRDVFFGKRGVMENELLGSG